MTYVLEEEHVDYIKNQLKQSLEAIRDALESWDDPQAILELQQEAKLIREILGVFARAEGF